jgi:hypothetical protein
MWQLTPQNIRYRRAKNTTMVVWSSCRCLAPEQFAAAKEALVKKRAERTTKEKKQEVQ